MKKKSAFILAMCLGICVLFGGCSSNTADSSEKEGGIIDLTAHSADRVYAEVYNMMFEPEQYLGKTIIMEGPYTYGGYDEKNKEHHHYIIIEDAEACCQQGLEVLLPKKYEYPKDYPKEEEKVRAEGVYEGYEYEGNIYYRIVTDKLEKVDA